MALYPEFENENSLRSFPFAEGCSLFDTDGVALDTHMFIDAMIYPTRPHGRVRLSAIDFDNNILEVSDDDGIIGTGVLGDQIQVVSNDGVYMGTILTRGLETTAAQRREFTELFFSSSCVFAFNVAGVTGIRIGNTIMTGKIVLEKSSTITPELTDSNGDGEYELSLSVTSTSAPDEAASIKKIIVMRSKGTIFGVKNYFSANSIEVNLGTLSRENVCENAHREDMIDIYDTCDPDDTPEPTPPRIIPAREDSFWVFDFTAKASPSSTNTIMRQAFNILVPNLVDPANIVNPLNVQMIEGTMQNNPPKFTRTMNDAQAAIQMKKLTSSNVVGNGVLLQIPGLQ